MALASIEELDVLQRVRPSRVVEQSDLLDGETLQIQGYPEVFRRPMRAARACETWIATASVPDAVWLA